MLQYINRYIDWTYRNQKGIRRLICCDICQQVIGHQAVVVSDGHIMAVFICRSCADQVLRMYDQQEVDGLAE